MRRDETPAPPPPPAQYRRADSWWAPGGPRPLIDAAPPAVAQAIGRCLTWRILRGVPRRELTPREKHLFGSAPTTLDHVSIHPRPCSWCDYPDAVLREALGYAAFVSRFDLIGGEYANEEWRRFYAGVTPATRDLPPEAWQKAAQRRHAAIEQAMYGEPGE